MSIKFKKAGGRYNPLGLFQVSDMQASSVNDCLCIQLRYKMTTSAIALLFLLGMPANSVADSPPPNGRCVILLHGLARTHRSMNDMAEALTKAGYRTVNMDYESRRYPIEKLATQVIPEALAACRAEKCNDISFVTHSMGGILLRSYLSRHTIAELGRVVMLSPPNQGSEAADYLQKYWLYKWYNGPAGRQLVTGPDGLPAHLGPADFAPGIITGNVHSFFDAWLSKIIPGEDDGKVSVERAKIEGMSDFLVLPCAHSFIMDQEEVISQTIYFLSHGRFLRKQTTR